MKKIIASALFFACALSMSAQSVQLIDNNQLKPEDVALELGADQFGMIAAAYATDPSAINAIVKDINDMVATDPSTYNKAWAINELEERLTVEEQKTGDFNLDGDFDVMDLQDVFDAYNADDAGFDYDGDGFFDVMDLQEIFDMYNAL